MKQSKIERMIASLKRLHPLQGAILVFNEKTGIIGLMRLRGLSQDNTSIRVEDSKSILMVAVCASNDWGGDRENRTYIVYGLQNVEDDKFLREILKDVDSIEVGDHGAKKLLSGRKKVRDEFAEELILRTLVSTFLNEMEEWEVFVEAYQHKLEDETPCLIFKLEYENTVFALVTLDAFTGRVDVNGCYLEELFTEPRQLQDCIRSKVESHMEDTTM